MFDQPFAKSIISRNRLKVLLRMLHFIDNEETSKNDRFNKIRELVDTLNDNFTHFYTPNENICVDESMVPFRGQITFRQYNKQKRHKYGIQVFKLCSIPGNTYKLEIYAGKHFNTVNTTPNNVVVKLCHSVFNKGHTLYTDSWYTSINLADILLEKDTHLVRILRKNRKHLSKELVNAKLITREFSKKMRRR